MRTLIGVILVIAGLALIGAYLVTPTASSAGWRLLAGMGSAFLSIPTLLGARVGRYEYQQPAIIGGGSCGPCSGGGLDGYDGSDLRAAYRQEQAAAAEPIEDARERPIITFAPDWDTIIEDTWERANDHNS